MCFGILAVRHVGSSLPDRGGTDTPCLGRRSLTHWTALLHGQQHSLKEAQSQPESDEVCTAEDSTATGARRVKTSGPVSVPGLRGYLLH